MSKIFLPNLISNAVLSSDNLYRQGGRGLVCVFSLKNPAHPEYVCEAKSGVMCLDFHSNHPHMLVAGLYDGNVAVYNLQSSLTRPLNIAPLHESDAANGKHMETVSQVKWLEDDLDNYLNFFSGKNTITAFLKQLCLSFCYLVSEDSRVTHWTLVKTTLTCCNKMILDFGKPLQNIDMEMLRGTKFGSGARALAVKPDDPSVYLVGTEEGLIHLCTTEYSSKYLATFRAHNTPVRQFFSK